MTTNATLLLLLPLLLFVVSMAAQDYDLITSTTAQYSEPAVPKPAYLQFSADPTFGTNIKRTVGDVGTTIPNSGGQVWRNVARHGYNTRQAWNAGILL